MLQIPFNCRNLQTNNDNPVEDYTFYEHQHHDCNQTEVSDVHKSRWKSFSRIHIHKLFLSSSNHFEWYGLYQMISYPLRSPLVPVTSVSPTQLCSLVSFSSWRFSLRAHFATWDRPSGSASMSVHSPAPNISFEMSEKLRRIERRLAQFAAILRVGAKKRV